MNNNHLPQTADEYIACFRQLASMTNQAIDNLANPAHPLSESDRKKCLNNIAKAVETVAALRGDTNIFEAARPAGLNQYQSEMYQTEDALRARIVQLGYEYPQNQ